MRVSDHVYCEDCDNVHSATRDAERPYKWRCMAFPVKPGYGFVSRSHAPDPPYARCDDSNRKGYCGYWTPLREPPEK